MAAAQRQEPGMYEWMYEHITRMQGRKQALAETAEPEK